MALLSGYLYVIADKDRKFVKIGMSRDVRVRFYQISVMCPLDLELLSFYPCSYARYREHKVHEVLMDLYRKNEWFCWDEVKVTAAVKYALDIPDTEIRQELAKLKQFPSQDLDFPVRRGDTGEVYRSSRAAAETVFGSKKAATKIRRAVKDSVKCGPTYWARVHPLI